MPCLECGLLSRIQRVYPSARCDHYVTFVNIMTGRQLGRSASRSKAHLHLNSRSESRSEEHLDAIGHTQHASHKNDYSEQPRAVDLSVARREFAPTEHRLRKRDRKLRISTYGLE